MDIGILGGGIAGLSTAIALKLKGFDVAVYERFEVPSTIGAGLVCWPNACFVLEQLGVLSEIAHLSGDISKMSRYDQNGDLLGTMNIRNLNKLMRYPSYSIARPDFLKVLTSRANQLGIEIRYNHHAVSITDNDTIQTTLWFKDGSHVSPDIIIGTDGRMNSLARKYVHGNNRPVYQNIVNWIGVYEGAEDIFEELNMSDYWGIGERFSIVPINSKKAIWSGEVKTENIDPLEPKNYKPELIERFQDWPTPVGKIVNETAAENINKIYVHDHDPIETWQKNNVLLLGDSVHPPLPTSAQGACQSLEDAWHFANCLNDNPDDIHTAFTDFTNVRIHKTTGISLSGRQSARSILSDDKEYCAIRNNESKAMDFEKSIHGMAVGWSSGLPIEI